MESADFLQERVQQERALQTLFLGNTIEPQAKAKNEPLQNSLRGNLLRKLR